MISWWRKEAKKHASPEQQLRSKYASFRNLLSLNNECLEILSSVQEDLQYVGASQRILGDRLAVMFDKLESGVTVLERLTGETFAQLSEKVRSIRDEVEAEIGERDELPHPPLARSLSEVNWNSEREVGGKAAALGEIRNRLSLPVPEGFAITAEAYRQFCGVPLWKQIRDGTRNLDLNDLAKIEAASAQLIGMLDKLPLPRAVEVALTARANTLVAGGGGLAIRSSGVGEGGARTFAGQFATLLNVQSDGVADAYRAVVASRFSAKALFYRLSAGLAESDSPMAVLCMPLIRSRASGILYTRDPANPREDKLWITATGGLGVDIASGRAPADLYVMSRKAPYDIHEQNIARKEEQALPQAGGGVSHEAVDAIAAAMPSMQLPWLRQLTAWGIAIEEHFGCPQDIEWALDENDALWIIQSRPLTLVEEQVPRSKAKVRGEQLLAGGQTIYPGRVSGPAHLVHDLRELASTPRGSIAFMRKASPEIVEMFPRISGLVAEWGNVTGHAAALLREFAIPSVFQLGGAFEKVKEGEEVSLDAVQPRVYSGALWPPRHVEEQLPEHYREESSDPFVRSVLTLHLLDPASLNFRPQGCSSAHDVLRFCHEKAIEAMFVLNDREVEIGSSNAKRLLTPAPINMHVLDLGGGLACDPRSDEVRPSEIVSRPFQALWRGVTHPGVAWTRAMSPSLSDVASIMASSLGGSTGAIRALGERSYLLVADEYMNLNSRLAYHFTLVDACVSDVPGNNYVAFRFAGGGATRQRRNLRASFIEACLSHYGFRVDRRGDLVNAWFKKAPAEETEFHLDILGRLMACSSQLDMYMTGSAAASSYVQAFLAGDYTFHETGGDVQAGQNVKGRRRLFG
ncbi:MAG: PEP/pyruvate-binding domain-containing protein [Acidobacteriota bacterium]